MPNIVQSEGLPSAAASSCSSCSLDTQSTQSISPRSPCAEASTLLADELVAKRVPLSSKKFSDFLRKEFDIQGRDRQVRLPITLEGLLSALSVESGVATLTGSQVRHWQDERDSSRDIDLFIPAEAQDLEALSVACTPRLEAYLQACQSSSVSAASATQSSKASSGRKGKGKGGAHAKPSPPKEAHTARPFDSRPFVKCSTIDDGKNKLLKFALGLPPGQCVDILLGSKQVSHDELGSSSYIRFSTAQKNGKVEQIHVVQPELNTWLKDHHFLVLHDEVQGGLQRLNKRCSKSDFTYILQSDLFDTLIQRATGSGNELQKFAQSIFKWAPQLADTSPGLRGGQNATVKQLNFARLLLNLMSESPPDSSASIAVRRAVLEGLGFAEQSNQAVLKLLNDDAQLNRFALCFAVLGGLRDALSTWWSGSPALDSWIRRYFTEVHQVHLVEPAVLIEALERLPASVDTSHPVFTESILPLLNQWAEAENASPDLLLWILRLEHPEFDQLLRLAPELSAGVLSKHALGVLKKGLEQPGVADFLRRTPPKAWCPSALQVMAKSKHFIALLEKDPAQAVLFEGLSLIAQLLNHNLNSFIRRSSSDIAQTMKATSQCAVFDRVLTQWKDGALTLELAPLFLKLDPNGQLFKGVQKEGGYADCVYIKNQLMLCATRSSSAGIPYGQLELSQTDFTTVQLTRQQFQDKLEIQVEWSGEQIAKCKTLTSLKEQLSCFSRAKDSKGQAQIMSLEMKGELKLHQVNLWSQQTLPALIVDCLHNGHIGFTQAINPEVSERGALVVQKGRPVEVHVNNFKGHVGAFLRVEYPQPPPSTDSSEPSLSLLKQLNFQASAQWNATLRETTLGQTEPSLIARAPYDMESRSLQGQGQLTWDGEFSYTYQGPVKDLTPKGGGLVRYKDGKVISLSRIPIEIPLHPDDLHLLHGLVIHNGNLLRSSAAGVSSQAEVQYASADRLDPKVEGLVYVLGTGFDLVGYKVGNHLVGQFRQYRSHGRDLIPHSITGNFYIGGPFGVSKLLPQQIHIEPTKRSESLIQWPHIIPLNPELCLKPHGYVSTVSTTVNARGEVSNQSRFTDSGFFYHGYQLMLPERAVREHLYLSKLMKFPAGMLCQSVTLEKGPEGALDAKVSLAFVVSTRQGESLVAYSEFSRDSTAVSTVDLVLEGGEAASVFCEDQGGFGLLLHGQTKDDKDVIVEFAFETAGSASDRIALENNPDVPLLFRKALEIPELQSMCKQLLQQTPAQPISRTGVIVRP